MTQPPNVLVVSAEAITGHQFRFKAGVPGCSCGAQFVENTGHPPAVLHAVHLAPFVVVRVLRSAAEALHTELPAAEAAAAVSALAGMVREETPAAQRKALQQ